MVWPLGESDASPFPPGLVCYQSAIGWSTNRGADPNATCALVVADRVLIKARKEPLIVDATPTDSCIPVFPSIPAIYRVSFDVVLASNVTRCAYLALLCRAIPS
jgi:hypothetical protein